MLDVNPLLNKPAQPRHTRVAGPLIGLCEFRPGVTSRFDLVPSNYPPQNHLSWRVRASAKSARCHPAPPGKVNRTDELAVSLEPGAGQS